MSASESSTRRTAYKCVRPHCKPGRKPCKRFSTFKAGHPKECDALEHHHQDEFCFFLDEHGKFTDNAITDSSQRSDKFDRTGVVRPAPLLRRLPCTTLRHLWPPACHADALWLVLLQHARSGPRKRKRTAIESQLAAQFGAGLSRYLVGKMSWSEARLQVAQLLRQLKDMRNRVLDYAELAEQLCCACGHHLALHGWQVIPPASACLTVRLPLGQRCHVSRASDERMDERCRWRTARSRQAIWSAALASLRAPAWSTSGSALTRRSSG